MESSPEEALRIVSAQMPLEEKLKVADMVIRNRRIHRRDPAKGQGDLSGIKAIGPSETEKTPAGRALRIATKEDRVEDYEYQRSEKEKGERALSDR